jgi:hypothetical protein
MSFSIRFGCLSQFSQWASLAGAEYVCKCLGANQYELNKYSFANSVTLSASIVRLIMAIDASGERLGGTHEKTGWW